jgi:drug/metabolite transporter (DMT)-like permease
MNKKVIAYIMLTGSSVIFGFSFLLTKEALEHLKIFQMLGLRFLIAAVVMAILVLTRVIKIDLTRSKIKAMLPLVVLQPLVYFIGETYGIKLTSSSESGMMIAIMPIAIALFSIRVLKEKLFLRQWLAVLASVIGVAMIIGATGFGGTSGNILGYLLLLVAVAAEGLYAPLAKKMTSKCTPVEMTFLIVCGGAIAFNAIGLTEAAVAGEVGAYFTDALSADVMSGLLYLSVASSVVAFFCINYALSKVKASSSASFCNLTTVVSVLAGVALGGEKLQILQIAGMALILLSIWGIVSDGTPKIKEEVSEISLKS